MTGFGSEERDTDAGHTAAEVRTVNSRFLDVSVSLPPQLSSYQREINKIASQKFRRGKIDISIRVADMKAAAQIDEESAASYMDAIIKLSDKLHLTRPADETLLNMVLSHEGVVKDGVQSIGDAGWNEIKAVAVSAMDKCLKDRAREGEALKADLTQKLSVLEKCANVFKEYLPRMEERFKQEAIGRFTAIMQEEADMSRVMQEVAALMVRYTINEEVVRLSSHIASLHAELEMPYPGKRLDFICQEAGREINTIGSKNPFADISSVVVDAKDALEAIREQARNVE